MYRLSSNGLEAVADPGGVSRFPRKPPFEMTSFFGLQLKLSWHFCQAETEAPFQKSWIRHCIGSWLSLSELEGRFFFLLRDCRVCMVYTLEWSFLN